ncbi:hypothetical protein ARMGADRAFT_1039175 [Armillaria gallica]|uniref:Uncharacterized protein n=1 Tax=Armillaria gallica TaxID=47427 RepID=A0A2H3CJY7_ARMGA|nr:hypothetical protein ARMGADRAFT_1039175 [Armillaria gallica]
MARITIAFVEYNELVARARQSGIRLFPLPIPDAPAQRQTPVLRAGSQASLSPFQTRQKSVAPPTTPHLPTPTKEKTPVPSQRSLPREQTPTSPTPKKAVSSSDSTWPIPVRRLASSKANSGASVTKSSAGPSFLGLRETDSRREGSPWGAYNTSSSRRPGWGTPAWSTPSPSDSDSSSPSKLSFGLSFGPATLLPSSLPLNDTVVDFPTQNTLAQPSNAGLLAVDASSRPNVIPQEAGSNAPSQDNESEQGQGTPVGDAFEVAVTELTTGNDDVQIPPSRTAFDREANPPPYVRQEPEISFVFDDITGDWDPYPTILLPRPQRSAPTEQEVRCSSRPHASPVGHDAAYLAAAQGSKPKKDKKSKNKGPDTAPCKRTRHEDIGDETTERPAVKKPRVKDVVLVSDDERKSFLANYFII